MLKASHAVYKLLGVRIIVTSSYHPNGNGGVERVNHTLAQMLAMVVNELQNNWDEQLRAVPKFAVGGWLLVYNTTDTICQGVKTDTGDKALKAKLSLNWTAPYKVHAVGPRAPADTPDGSPLGAKLLYLDLPSDMPGADTRRRVSVQRCKPCANPHDQGDMPKYLTAGLTQYVLINFSKNPPPYHVTQDNISTSLQRLELEKITGHQPVAVAVGSSP